MYPVVEEGDKAIVKYSVRLEDGSLIETTCEPVAREAGIYSENNPYVPVEVVVGSGFFIVGFEQALIGMKKGEKMEKIPIVTEEGTLFFDIRIVDIKKVGKY